MSPELPAVPAPASLEPPTPTQDAAREQRLGLAFGLAAYLWWGFVVVYFKAVANVPPLEVLAAAAQEK